VNNYSWTCPHCDRAVTITGEMDSAQAHVLRIENSMGKIATRSYFVVCPNPECNNVTVTVALYEWVYVGANPHLSHQIKQWRLYPEGNAKVFPEYIPQAIREDYIEACLIRDLSPKASATLARRCLQGIVRNFWSVKPGRLVDEIRAIEEKVDPTTWAAIDAVRQMGNIGAHMEKDIGVIVEVDADEATLMIELVETLLEDWYIAKHDKEARMAALIATAATKKAESAAANGPPQTQA